jgi:hypothetical protein
MVEILPASQVNQKNSKITLFASWKQNLVRRSCRILPAKSNRNRDKHGKIKRHQKSFRKPSLPVVSEELECPF